MLEAFGRYKYSLLYFVSIVLTNALYAKLGAQLMWATPFGDGTTTWSPLAIIVGFWFILRDFAQEELGRKVLAVMAAGMVASYAMAGGVVATASAIAFAAGELTDFAVYTYMRHKPFARRMLVSSLASAPIDTFLFFAVADMLHMVPGVQTLSWPTVLTETVSKLAAAAFVFYRINKRTMTVGDHCVA